MIGRPRAHTALGDDFDPYAFHVFIPGALASGFLISVGLLIGDAFRKVRGDTGIERRVMHTGAAVSDEVRSGAGASRGTGSGLRARWVYGLVGVISVGLVLAVIPGATWNFLNPGGYISNIGWIWAISALLVIGFGILGVQMLRLVPEWIPLTIGIVGLGFILRFALGSEPATLRGGLVVLGVVATVVGVAATWRMRRHRERTDVPPSARPILNRTPLSRSR
jgi:hypothetical protein